MGINVQAKMVGLTASGANAALECDGSPPPLEYYVSK